MEIKSNQERERYRESSRETLRSIKKIMYRVVHKKQKHLFPFIGGAVGYVRLRCNRQYENIGEIPKDEMNVPDVHFCFLK